MLKSSNTLIKNVMKERKLEERVERSWEKYSWEAVVRVHDLYLNRRCCANLYDSMLEGMKKAGVLSKEPINNYGVFSVIHMIHNPRNSKGEIFYFTSKKSAGTYNSKRHKSLMSTHEIKKITPHMFTPEGKPLYC
ncbi:MAG: hypothetical protein KKE23_01820 [Nanoarchaeota archaeon]|nr:hypothetical protein [Nanoarchaeota archaeon]